MASCLYATNLRAGTVAVVDSNFAPMSLGTGALVDPTLPVGFSPYNGQVLAGRSNQIYVTSGTLPDSAWPMTCLLRPRPSAASPMALSSGPEPFRTSTIRTCPTFAWASQPTPLKRRTKPALAWSLR